VTGQASQRKSVRRLLEAEMQGLLQPNSQNTLRLEGGAQAQDQIEYELDQMVWQQRYFGLHNQRTSSVVNTSIRNIDKIQNKNKITTILACSPFFVPLSLSLSI
jgi:hypothetical protein